MQDIVEITIPRERDFSIVAGLVVGGIAALYDDEGAVVGCGVVSSASRN